MPGWVDATRRHGFKRPHVRLGPRLCQPLRRRRPDLRPRLPGRLPQGGLLRGVERQRFRPHAAGVLRRRGARRGGRPVLFEHDGGQRDGLVPGVCGVRRAYHRRAARFRLRREQHDRAQDLLQGELSRYRCHLACILLKMPAVSLLTGPDHPLQRQLGMDSVAEAWHRPCGLSRRAAVRGVEGTGG